MWPWRDPDPIEQRTIGVESQVDGSFAFLEAPFEARETGSVLWATLPGYQANFEMLAPGGEGWSESRLLKLQHRPALPVRVIDAPGGPVVGARVEHVSWGPHRSLPPNHPERSALSLFWRRAVTDAGGLVRLGGHPGIQALRARKGAELSSVWLERELDTGPVTLRMFPSFQIGGTVESDAPELGPAVLSINCYAISDAWQDAVGFASVRGDWSWGPLPVPATSNAGYVVTLQGKGFISDEIRIGSPPPGTSIDVLLRARRGFTLEVHVQTGGDEPIAGAIVQARLQLDDRSVESSGLTDREGKTSLEGMATGSMFLSVSASGFVPWTSKQLAIESPAAGPIEVVLEPAGILKGRVVHRGEPVREFEVLSWRAESDPHTFSTHRFEDRDDGSFEIADVPLGDVLVLAFSATHPRCEAQQVLVESSRPGEVVLELPVAILGRGRVIDIATGAAPEGAYVQAWSNFGGKLLRPAGDPLRTAPDGAFELPALGPGDARFEASAPGYARYLGHVQVQSGDPIDLGTIPLTRVQTLTVVLDIDESLDFEEYSLSLVGNEWHPIQRFNDQGQAVVEDVSPARWQITVDGPEIRLWSLEELRPGADWVVSFDLSGSCTLTVRARSADGTSLSNGLDAVVQPPAVRRSIELTRRLDPRDGASFRGLHAGPAGVHVYGPGGNLLGSTSVELEEGVQDVEVEIGGALHELLILDPNDAPLTAAYVQVYDGSGRSAWNLVKESDTQGRCSFLGLDREGITCGVWHRAYGWHPRLQLERRGEHAYAVRLDSTHTLKVRLLDGAIPLPSVQILFRDVTGLFPLNDRLTDSEGFALHELVGRGRYRATIDQPGLWTTHHDFEVDRDTAVNLQVRRTGDLRISARSLGGAAISTQPIELGSQEFGLQVSNWVTSGRVGSSTDSMLTDSNGELELKGLPRGPYSWIARSSGSSQASGMIDLVEGKLNELTIQLQ